MSIVTIWSVFLNPVTNDEETIYLWLSQLLFLHEQTKNHYMISLEVIFKSKNIAILSRFQRVFK